jgi:hypothetical protein
MELAGVAGGCRWPCPVLPRPQHKGLGCGDEQCGFWKSTVLSHGLQRMHRLGTGWFGVIFEYEN